MSRTAALALRADAETAAGASLRDSAPSERPRAMRVIVFRLRADDGHEFEIIAPAGNPGEALDPLAAAMVRSAISAPRSNRLHRNFDQDIRILDFRRAEVAILETDEGAAGDEGERSIIERSADRGGAAVGCDDAGDEQRDRRRRRRVPRKAA